MTKMAAKHYTRRLLLRVLCAWHGIIESRWKQHVEKACQVTRGGGGSYLAQFLIHTLIKSVQRHTICMYVHMYVTEDAGVEECLVESRLPSTRQLPSLPLCYTYLLSCSQTPSSLYNFTLHKRQERVKKEQCWIGNQELCSQTR